MVAVAGVMDDQLAALLPLGSDIGANGHLTLGGVDVAELVATFGTPLYVYDEDTVRAACRAYVAAFAGIRQANRVHYAAKAYLALWLCRLLREEGLGCDVVSTGELHVALTGGIEPSQIRFHGNNKLPGELRDAIAAGIGCIVVDNHDEVCLLDELARPLGRRVPVLLRLSPGIEAHTHEYLKTGLLDSKFGLPIATGDALRAVRRVLASPALALEGYHAHVGTALFDPAPIAEGARRLRRFAESTHAATGYWPRELSPGGGLGVAYERGDDPPPVGDLAAAIDAVLDGMRPLPVLSVEPGRSIAGRAGVALYTAGMRKDIPGVRTYVSVDGGMADNIRPALYGARYTALAATRMGEASTTRVTVAGRYCESGDILVRDVALPPLETGDLLAIPAAGAYCLAMSSAYNGAPRPAVVTVRDGQARLVQRRGLPADTLAYDVT